MNIINKIKNKLINKRLKHNTKRAVFDYILVLAGTLLYALSVHIFKAPNNIAPGGVTGIAIALNYLTAFPIGTYSLIINIPIMIVGIKSLGHNFMIKTIISIIWFALLTDVLFNFIPDELIYRGDTMLAALFGGVLGGIGLAAAFLGGGSTGGTDIANRVVQKKLPHIKLGKIVFLTDIIVIAFAVSVYRNLEAGLYAIIAMYSASVIVDKILYGIDIGKIVIIITEYPEKVCKPLMERLERGCTILESRGGYTGESKSVIICVVHKNQFYKVKSIVWEEDSSAFIVISDASEIMGNGFKQLY